MPKFEEQMKALVDSGGRTDVDFGEMCSSLLHEFGGYGGIAREAYRCMTDPDATPNTKSNIIKNVLSIIEAYARINKDASPGESSMTDDELLEQAQPFLSTLGLSGQPRLSAADESTSSNPSDDYPAPAPQAVETTPASDAPAV